MDKIWLNSYQNGVVHEIPTIQHNSLIDAITENCQKFADYAAFENFGTSLSYRELFSLAKSFAAYLQQELGIKKGDRFGIMTPNCLQYPIALLGIMLAGGVVVNINPLYTPTELLTQLQDSGTVGILILENFAPTLSKIINETSVKHVILTQIGDRLPMVKGSLINFFLKYIKGVRGAYDFTHAKEFNKIIEHGFKLKLTKVGLTQDDIAFLQYTGGTTGKAKGAILTHKNMLYNVAQATAWLKPTLVEGEEIIVTALPLYHIFSLTANCLTFMNYGALNILVTNPKELSSFVKLLKTKKFTAITAVNTLFNALINYPKFKEVDFSRLKIALGGGMAVQNIVAEKWHKITGMPILEAYGLTETSPAVCINPINTKMYNGTIGLPVPSTEILLRDPQGKEVPIGSAGELYVRGPQVMQGYWQQPEETAKVLSKDGWLATGDIGIINPSGYIKIVDRKKDMILVSGFNVYPNEIEDVIVGMDGIIEAAVIGICPDGFNEMVKAYVITTNPEIKEIDVINYCRKYLTGYKVPKMVEFRDSLPKSNVGKILRRALKEELKK